jgi:hypothetical protein
MGASFEHPEKVHHLIQMLLGIFAAHGVLALGDKPIYSHVLPMIQRVRRKP